MASKIELETIRWIGERVGWPGEFNGTFTSGGNEANFSGLALALTAKFPDSIEEGVSSIGGQPVAFRRPSDALVSNRFHQVGFVDQGAAGRIDEKRARLHLGERRAIDELPRLGRRRHVQAQVIRLGQQFIERHETEPVLGGEGVIRIWFVGEKFHAETVPAEGDRLADAP